MEQYIALEVPRVGVNRPREWASLTKLKDRALAKKIAKGVMENLSLEVFGDALAIFARDLHSLGGRGDRDIDLGALIGYMIGTLENTSGVERSGESECHYLLALELITSRYREEVRVPGPLFEFAIDGGYFLARTRDRSLDRLLQIATEQVPGFLSRIERP